MTIQKIIIVFTISLYIFTVPLLAGEIHTAAHQGNYVKENH